MIASGNSDRGILLHRRPYSDTKWLVDFLTDEHGRINGVQRQGSQGRGVAVLFVEYEISWRGKGQLPTITHCESRRTHHMEGKKLYFGLYLNELIVRTTRPHEYVDGLYEAYQDVITAMTMEDDVEPLLRTFERGLLKGLGYEIVFDHEFLKGDAIDPTRMYRFVRGRGFRLAEVDDTEGFEGESLLAIAGNDYSQTQTRRIAKLILRNALQECTGGQPILARSLFQQPRNAEQRTRQLTR